MKKTIVICLIMLIMFIFSGCIPDGPNEKEMIDDLMETSVVNYYIFDGSEDYPITSLEVEKRQTNEKEDLVFCTVVFDNENYTISQDLKLIYNYYDEGGWILDDYEYEDDPYIIPKVGISEDYAVDFFLTQVPIDQTKQTLKIIDDELYFDDSEENYYHAFTIELSSNYEYYDAVTTYELKCPFRFQGIYDWLWGASVSEISNDENWNILGQWQFNYPNGDELTLIINSFEDGIFNCDYYFYYIKTGYNLFSTSDDKLITSTGNIDFETKPMDNYDVIVIDGIEFRLYKDSGIRFGYQEGQYTPAQ